MGGYYYRLKETNSVSGQMECVCVEITNDHGEFDSHYRAKPNRLNLNPKQNRTQTIRSASHGSNIETTQTHKNQITSLLHDRR